MTLDVSAHRYGHEAEAALLRALDLHKRPNGVHDPLAPVTIVVPTAFAGYHVRRVLGARPGGAVNVQVKPLQALLEVIGATELSGSGRRPLPEVRRSEVIREVARAGPPVFGDVPIDGPVLRTLTRQFREFDECDRGQLDTIAGQGNVPEYLVRRYDAYLTRTREFYTQRDLADSATAALEDRRDVLRDIGSVIVYLPGDLTAAEHRFLSALATHTDVAVLVGMTGDHEAVDRHSLETWGLVAQRSGAGAEDVPTAHQIVQAPDAEEEIRFAIRQIAESLHSDEPTPLHRTAILFPEEVPYRRICAEQLDAAGLTWNGANSETLGQSIAGRTLNGLLGLITGDTVHWTDDVAPWLAAAPILDERGELAPIARWNQLSRRANLQRGPDEWAVRLDRYRRTCEDDLERLERFNADEDRPGRTPWVRAEIAQVEELATFVSDLAAFMQDTPASGDWSDFARIVREQLGRLLGNRQSFARYASSANDLELARWDDVQALLSELSWLDDISEATAERFVSAAQRGLERVTGHHGRVGDGVHVGPLNSAVGMQWDAVYIVGSAERSLPQARSEDPLLPDPLRARVSLPGAADHMRRQRADYLIALLAAERRVLSYPRADARAEKARLPGRWLLESATSLNHGERIYASKIDRAPLEIIQATPSFEHAVTADSEPADLQEFDLRSLRRTTEPREHYLCEVAPALSRGFEQRQERWQPTLTRWDGLIAGGASEAAALPHSAGALQDWGTCPYRYFLARVLRIQERDELRDDLQISPLDKGSLIHDILDQFFAQTAEAREGWNLGDRWFSSEGDLLESIATERLEQAHEQGLTGRELLWRRDSRRILDDLQTFLERDAVHRETFHVKQIDSELAFGALPESRGLVELTLSDGSILKLRGMIDRVDRGIDGNWFIVIDYKTGVEFPKQRELVKDVVVGGRYLQLPVYAHAARELFGLAPDATVFSAYWYITERGEFTYNQIDWDQENTQRFTDTINLIIEHIRAGRFPANPGGEHHRAIAEHCNICSFNAICPADRREHWDQIKLDPDLADYVELTEPPNEEESD